MCQEFPKEKWIDAQKENVLDAPYYHVVFTVPEELNPIIQNVLSESGTMVCCRAETRAKR